MPAFAGVVNHKMKQTPEKADYWRKHFDRVARSQHAPEKRSSYFSSGNTRALHSLVKKYLETIDDAKILDAGCAEGAVTTSYAEKNTVVGLDFSNNMLRLAKTNGLLAVCGDVTAPPFAENSFDVVVCIEVVTCVQNPYEGIVALAKLVRPGGILVLSVLNAASVLRKIVSPVFALFVKDLPTPLSYDRVRATLEGGGFVIEKTQFTHLMPGNAIVSEAGSTTRIQLFNANNMIFLARRI